MSSAWKITWAFVCRSHSRAHTKGWESVILTFVLRLLRVFFPWRVSCYVFRVFFVFLFLLFEQSTRDASKVYRFHNLVFTINQNKQRTNTCRDLLWDLNPYAHLLPTSCCSAYLGLSPAFHNMKLPFKAVQIAMILKRMSHAWGVDACSGCILKQQTTQVSLFGGFCHSQAISSLKWQKKGPT